MLFAHDTEVALAAAAALVNTLEYADTAVAEIDRLPDTAALDAFVAEWNWTGSRRHDRRELDEVRALRPRLRRICFFFFD